MATGSRSGKSRRFAAVAVVLGVVLGFVAGELAIRAVSTTDPNGSVLLDERFLNSERPGMARTTEVVNRLDAQWRGVRLQYDAGLGWTVRPGCDTDDGRFRIDERGVRIGTGPVAEGTGPTVALYGDSFTFGAEVRYEDSFGHRLQAQLTDADGGHRVLNLGVGGYGMDQAYLRWRATEAEFRPDVVVFGLYPGDMLRNVNLIRVFYDPRSLVPYSKPRFVLDGDDLALLNVPCMPPDEVQEVLRDPTGWDLSAREAFHVEHLPPPKPWQRSRLLCAVFDCNEAGRIRNARKSACYRPGSEAFEVTLRIVRRFRDEVEASGAGFVVVHLPDRGHLSDADDGRPMVHDALMAALAADGMTIADPTPELLALARRDGVGELFMRLGHYSPAANQIVADVLAPVVLDAAPSP